MTNGTFTLQLVLTNFCNLSCRYCYVLPGREAMPLDVACNAVDEAAGVCAEKGLSLSVAFMGGEPLAEFGTIRAVCEYTWQKYTALDVTFHSPTNGTLLDKEMRQWFCDNRERIALGLSFDGKLSQDRNRSNSSSCIDIDFFSEMWPDQPLKMTISESSVNNLAADIISLHERGFNFGVNCACGEPEWSAESLKLFGEQMITLADYYNANDNITPCDLLAVDFLSIFQPRRPMQKRCGLGSNYITVYIDGKKYPCHMFSPLTLPPEKCGKYDFSVRKDFAVKGCEKCILNQTCPKCYGMQYRKFHSPFLRDMNLCRCFRLQSRAAAVYHIRRLHKKQIMTDLDKALLFAINRVINN